MDLRLAGKTAIVTGASKGIGLAVTRALVDEGVSHRLERRPEWCLPQLGDDLIRDADERRGRDGSRRWPGGLGCHNLQPRP